MTNTQLAPSKLHKTDVRSLPVRLTEEELLKKGSQLAATVQDIAAEEGRQVDLKAAMKAKLAEIDARRTQLAIAVSRKEEARDVEVDVWHHYDRGVVVDVRRDTGEIVNTRVMSTAERQPSLPLKA